MLTCSDLQLVKTTGSLWSWIKVQASMAILYAAAVLPTWLAQPIIPQPGQGPDRNVMEHGYLTLHGRATATLNDKVHKIATKFHFGKDACYLYTAALLVESGLLLLEKSHQQDNNGPFGILTPAAAFGSDLTRRIVERLDATFEIHEVKENTEAE